MTVKVVYQATEENLVLSFFLSFLFLSFVCVCVWGGGGRGRGIVR